jgi:ATP-dependent RNA helicase RhlE
MPFTQLGLNAALSDAVAAKGYATPTPIQVQAIPSILAGRDLLGGSQTGTGKTAAFTLPMLQRLATGKSRPRSPRGLILTPTRELAAQVGESVATYGKGLHLSSAVIFGGVGIHPQIDRLRRGVDILVATPGRLLDHVGQGTIDLSQVEIFVLDEADRMLDMGFIHDIRKVLKLLPARRQNLMFSATYSSEIKGLADGILRDPALVEVVRHSTAAETVTQVMHPVAKVDKRKLLSHLIKGGDWSQVLVFTRTKHGANRLAEQLGIDGIPAAAIHGNKSQGQRTAALQGFRSGSVRVLIATDIAARGIDVPGISHVVNFDLPDEAESYVHRIGRTGRNGMDGIAITLCDPSENSKLRQVERIIRTKLPIVADHLGSPDPQRNPAEKNERFEPANDRNDRNGRRDGRRPGGQNNGKKRFGDKPAFAGERKPEGAKPFKGNNKRRFGGKRPAARAA